MSPSTPAPTSGSSTSPSASPVNNAANVPHVARITTLDAFCAASITGAVGDTTSRRTLPTVSTAPASSCSTCPPETALASSIAADGISVAPAATYTTGTRMSPSSAGSPPKWSWCRWVITTASSDLTPALARAARSTPAEGPVSTRMACGPSRTRIASPCPTSRTSTSGPPGTGGPMARRPIPSASAVMSSRERCRIAAGHATHTHATSVKHTSEPRAAEKPSGTAACGHDASHPAKAAAIAPAAPAPRSRNVPKPRIIAPAASPTSPTKSDTDTSGPATRLARGATSESMPNVDTVSGTVATVAESVSATGEASHSSGFGRPAASHASLSRPKRTRPATAVTESWNPRSKALTGESANTQHAATASDAPPSVRRPPTHATAAAMAMTHARTADACTPENTT